MEVDLSRYGYIYRTTNLVNGKSYVGKHRVASKEKWFNYLGSGTALTRAVRKYCRESFGKELLAYADSESELDLLEAKLINREVLLNSFGVYNILISPNQYLVDRIEGYNVLKMYFEDHLSMTKIADAVGVSQPAVHSYLQRFREADPRFDSVVQGKALGISKNLGRSIPEHVKGLARERMLNLDRLHCESCGDKFASGGTLTTHRKNCDGTPWPHCSKCGKRLSKRGASLCREHSKYGPKSSQNS